MRKAFPSLLFFAVSFGLLAHADDLVTRDGTVYHDYKVLGHDAGFLTIMYSDGGGKIPLSNLPDDLQKKYGYNKQAADAAVQAAVAQDRQDRQAIAQEEAQHQQQIAAHAQSQAPGQADNVTPPVPAPATPAPAPEAVPNPSAVATAPAPPPTQAAAFKPNPNAPQPMTADEITDVENQIGTLTVDLRLMNNQRNKGDEMHNSSGVFYTEPRNSVFDDKIKDETAQIKELNARLIADSRLVGIAVPCMSEGEVDSTYDQIGALKKEQLILGIQSKDAETTVAKLAQDEAEQSRLEARLESNRRHAPRVDLPQDQVDAIRVQIGDLQKDQQRLLSEAGSGDGPYAQTAIDEGEQIDKLKEKIHGDIF